ncbi:MAG TPA: hypothetical protein VG621_02025 [Candidatus Paceibacterota bacterium]|nr:hypothetical protein [Candidatus Paceibacterota bacterium]
MKTVINIVSDFRPDVDVLNGPSVTKAPSVFSALKWKSITVHIPDDAEILEIAELLAQQIKPHLSDEYLMRSENFAPFLRTSRKGNKESFSERMANKIYLLLFGESVEDRSLYESEKKWMKKTLSGREVFFPKSISLKAHAQFYF